MPSDQCNSITAKATFLNFSLFDIVSAREEPFGIPQYVQCILQVSSFVFHSSLLTVKCINLVVVHDGSLCVLEIVHIFHSGYLDYRGAFQTVLDSYCCVTSQT